jgi:Flp pilus assembly protein TadD
MLSRTSAVLLLLLASACADSSPKPPTLDTGLPAPQVTALVSAADATRGSEAYGEALLIYQQILVSDSKNVAALYGIAECLFALGNAKEAKPIFDGLIENKDYRNLAWQGKGLTELALGQRDASEELLRKAVEADPTLWRSWNALGEIADFRHRPDEALTSYARALEIKPDSPAIINNIGYSKLLARQPEQAVVEFKKALALDSSSATIVNNLRLAMAASGNYAEAVKAAPRNLTPVVFNNVGYVAMERGDYSIAQAYLVRAMEGSPSYDSVAAKNLDQLKARQGTAP